MPQRTLIFIPTYNERENVVPMYEQIVALGLEADVLFLDDNSPDGTGAILDGLAREDSRVSVIHRSGKLGIGGAHLDGIAYAYDHGYDVFVTMDCDFTHSPSDIPKLAAYAESYDITVGSRYLNRGSLSEWSLYRKSLTHIGHFLTVNMLGISGDATGAFRVYRLRTIPRELFSLVRSRGYAFFFESLFVAHHNGLSIKDVPISLPARTYGHSKMTLDEIRRSVAQLAALYVAEKANPAQFRLSRAPADTSSLEDRQGWDQYWARKSTNGALAYDVIASTYRNWVIKPRLNSTIRDNFAAGSHLLHAGCGSGEVDADLHNLAKITAVDLSATAIERYRRANPRAFEVIRADIVHLPFADATFDGAYNLGVVEHFFRPQLVEVLKELRRVIKPNGKVVVFWPHARATSAMVLDSVHWVLNSALHTSTRLHPPEVLRVRGQEEAAAILKDSGLSLEKYYFGFKDGFVQAIVVARR